MWGHGVRYEDACSLPRLAYVRLVLMPYAVFESIHLDIVTDAAGCRRAFG